MGNLLEIDIRTLIIILGITHLLQVLVFAHQFRINKAFKGIGWWLLWSAAEVVGFGAMLLRNIPLIFNIVIVIQNVMIVGGAIFIYVGVRTFFNKSINFKRIILVFSLFLIGLLYFLFINNNIQNRSIIINAALAIIAFVTAFSLYTDKSKSFSTAANFNALIFLIHGGVFVFRLVLIINGASLENFFEPTLFNLLAFFDVLIASLLWTFGLIIMLNQRLNAEIYEAKEDLHLIFNTSPDAAMITRLNDGLIVDINEGYTTITGYTRHEMIGKSTLEVNIWKNIEDRNNVVQILKEKGYCDNYEASFLLKDGTEIIGLISAKVIKIHGVSNIISITRNISEHKKFEKEKLESDLLFKQLFENMDEGVAMHEMIYNSEGDPIDYRIVDVNQMFEKHTGISAQKARGSLATELYQTENAPYIKEYSNVVLNKKTLSLETHFDTINRDFGISVIYTKPRHFSTIFTNITDRKQKEAEAESLLETSEHSRKNLLSILEDQMLVQKALRTSEERYRSLLTNLEAGIVVHAPDTSIVMNNQKASELLGLSSEQMKGKLAIDPNWMFIRENKLPFLLDEHPVNQVIAKREPIRNLILGVVRPLTNDIAWLIVNGFPVFDNDGEITEILISFIEITAHIEAEEKLRESEKTFSEMFQKSPVTIVLSVPFDGTILDVNEAFLRDMEYNREEVIGHTALELGLFENPNERQNLVDILIDKRTVYGYECKFRSKSGEVMVGLLSIVFIKIAGKTCQLSTVIDINDRKLIEEELVNNNILLRTLINAIPTPVFYKNKEGVYTGVNKAFEDFFGKSSDQIKGKTVFDIMPIEIAQIYHDKDIELFDQSGAQIYEGKVISALNQIHEVVFHKAAILDINGKIQGLIGVFLDITERKLSEIKLMNSEERYRTTLDNMMEGCQIIDFDWKYIYLNQAAVNDARIEKEFLLNRSMLEVYPQVIDSKLYQMIKSCMEERISIYLENEFEYGNGLSAWFELSIQPVPEGVFILSIDITKRKISEFELLDLNKDLEKRVADRTCELLDLYNNAPCGYHSLDNNGMIELINNTELKWIGYEREEIVGKKNIKELLTEESKIIIAQNFPKFIQHGFINDLDLEFVCKDGSTLPVLLTATAIKDSSGKFLRSRSTMIDNTDRKKAEKIIHEAHEKLETSNKELEAFAYSVSHDLRAPLRHITGFIGLFLAQKSLQLNQEELNLLGTVSNSAEEMGKLIDALLTFSRFNKADLQKTPIDTIQLVQQSFQLFEKEIKDRSIEVNIGRLDECYGDIQLIRQVWSNLISNAIKYTGKKEKAIIEIGSYAEDNKIIFFVKDNGAGFNMKYVDKLFGVFQRLHKSRDFEGIGIGLANINRIVIRHGGRCWATGEIDKGAVFYFSLPQK